MLFDVFWWEIVLSRAAYLRGDDLDPPTDDEDSPNGSFESSDKQCAEDGRSYELNVCSHEELLALGMKKGRFVIQLRGERFTQRLYVCRLADERD